MFLSREMDIKLWQIFSIKQIIFNKYATNLKTTISHRSLKISHDFRLYHVTTILHCHGLKFWWRNMDYTVLYVSFNAWDSQVSFYTPFHFSFTVSLSYNLLIFSIYYSYIKIINSELMNLINLLKKILIWSEFCRFSSFNPNPLLVQLNI